MAAPAPPRKRGRTVGSDKTVDPEDVLPFALSPVLDSVRRARKECQMFPHLLSRCMA